MKIKGRVLRGFNLLHNGNKKAELAGIGIKYLKGKGSSSGYRAFFKLR